MQLRSGRMAFSSRSVLDEDPKGEKKAQLAIILDAYLRKHSPHGEWLNRRKVLQQLHAYLYGRDVVLAVLRGFCFNEVIEQRKIGRQIMIRLYAK